VFNPEIPQESWEIYNLGLGRTGVPYEWIAPLLTKVALAHYKEITSMSPSGLHHSITLTFFEAVAEGYVYCL
jgi:hypothetical protein